MEIKIDQNSQYIAKMTSVEVSPQIESGSQSQGTTGQKKATLWSATRKSRDENPTPTKRARRSLATEATTCGAMKSQVKEQGKASPEAKASIAFAITDLL